MPAPRLNKPLYESLPLLYLAIGAALLGASYQYAEAWWSALCSLAGLLALIAGLAVWMHRRDYRSTSSGYSRRGKPVGGADEERR
jgi:polyferredoxin